MEHMRMNKPISILAGLFLFLCFGYIGVVPGANEIFIPYLFLILYLFISELYKKQSNPLNNWAYAMMSQIYIALSFALLNVLAYHSSATESVSQYNPILPLSIFIFNWVNDTGAYCTGMLFGKHRLFERISPKKSWEGSIGGAVFSIIAAIVLAHFFTFLSTGVWIGLGLTVVVFGTWGDLTESLMKRTLGIKDSGNILPGHGGMLDRFDSTLMAVPAAVVYLYLVGLILA
jgi:cytidylyltransferase family